MTIKELLPEPILKVFLKYNVEELRFVYEKPVVTNINGKFFYISEAGDIILSSENGVVCHRDMINKIFKKACDNSVYAYEEDIKNGFVTIDGGHRIGICGKGVVKDGKLIYIKDISALNIRVSREITGCGKSAAEFIYNRGRVANTIIISPPGAGKTTLLRDIARLIGKEKKVGIADERGEISGGGRFDLGEMTVVMDFVPKVQAIDMMLRSMGLEVVITDEIGGDADAAIIEKSIYSGVSVIASIHGNDAYDVKRKNPRLYACFDKAVVLNKKRVEEMIECL